MIAFFIVCFVGNILLITQATNRFKESLFQSKNVVTLLIMSGLMITAFIVYANYLKNEHSKK